MVRTNGILLLCPRKTRRSFTRSRIVEVVLLGPGEGNRAMSNPETTEESLARSWLVSVSDGVPVTRCEHDPPDYLLGADTAVEVTRLSEQGRGGSCLPSLHSMEKVVIDVLVELEPFCDNTALPLCVFWVYEPLRELPKTKLLKRQVRDALKPYAKPFALSEGILDVPLRCGLSLRLANLRTTEHAPRFTFCGFSGTTGRHVRTRLLDDLEHAISEKSTKIQGKRSDHEAWWLVLVDCVFSSETFSFEGSNAGQRLLKDMKSLTRKSACTLGDSWPWSRIVVLAPQATCRSHILFDRD